MTWLHFMYQHLAQTLPHCFDCIRSLNCFSRINNRTRVCFYIPRQIGLKMIYPVIQIFINIWYWIRPPCIRLLWLWTFYYMWILVLYFQYPLFFRLWIFSPDCRRGIFHCSFILTSDSMCIYFFTSFILKKDTFEKTSVCFFRCRFEVNVLLSWISSKYV